MNEKHTIEEDLKHLEEIVSRLEKQETTLDESLALFDEGIRLSQSCRQELDRAQQVVEQRKMEFDLE